MGEKTKIEWTDSTWNPLRGCSRKSEGCRFCYAEEIAARFSGPSMAFEGLAHRVGGEARWTGKIVFAEEKLTQPLRWRRPRRIFVNSVSDLFHENVPDEWIDRIFAVMALAPQHTFQVLTKRSARMHAYFADAATIVRVVHAACQTDGNGQRSVEMMRSYWPLRNVWLGVSVEDQAAADERIPDLLATPAAVRFLSCEPLIGPVNLEYPESIWPEGPARCCSGQECGCMGKPVDPPLIHGIDWVIAGGESGNGARDNGFEENARSILRQCQAAGVSFFGKQNVRKAPLPADLMVKEFPHGMPAGGCRMIAPTYDPDISLTDNLKANGYGHRKSSIHLKQTVFSLETGAEVGTWDCVQCETWLKDRVRAFENRGAE